MSRLPAAVINRFWFGAARSDVSVLTKPTKAQMSLWFGSKPEDDSTIISSFAEHHRATSEHYASSSRDVDVRAIGLEQVISDIITLDQFTRVIHRKTARAFGDDAAAAALARAALRDDSFMREASVLERMFVEMPLMHSEDVADHVALLRIRGFDEDFIDGVDPAGAYDDHAVQHFATIKRFGRYPHRNSVLGREDTLEERSYLAQGARTYGQ